MSLSDVATLLGKLNIPATLVYIVARWILDYNDAINAWNDMPGSIKYGCNWSC